MPMTSTGDHAPVPHFRRTYSWWDFTCLWIGLVTGIPSYYIAGSLVELGMTWWQGIITIILSMLILLVPLLLTSIPGTHYGIPFPVFARASFGVRGAQIPTVLRALVACGWCGINTWIGGQAISLLAPASLPSTPLPFLGISPLECTCFLIFLCFELALLWNGMEGIRKLGSYSAPILITLTAALFVWALAEAGGLGEMLSPTSSLPRSEFTTLFITSISANVGTWSTLVLNIPDFTRYAKTQADQIAGQASIPILKGAFAFVGLAVTSATTVIFGAPISDPLRLVGKIVENSRGIVGFVVSIFAVTGIGLAVVTTNVPASVVASANVLVHLRPSLFSFRSAGVVTVVVGAVVFQPWRVYGSSESFLKVWLNGYASITGPMSGIMLVDYYAVRRMVLDVEELYSFSPKDCYYYWNGYNPNAIVALVVSFVPLLPGFLGQVGVVEGVGSWFEVMYDVSWFYGFFSGGLVYWVLSSSRRWLGWWNRTSSGEERLLSGFE